LTAYEAVLLQEIVQNFLSQIADKVARPPSESEKGFYREGRKAHKGPQK
jgi:hypothetical protein